MSKIDIPSRDALPAGFRLMDYDIEGLLGVGGFGLVYRAREAALQRTVAIKEYLPTSLALRGEGAAVVMRSPQHQEPFALGLRSFINEARLLARFDHPSLVKVYRFWEAHGTAYMVMPCYEGPTLYDARRAMQGPPDEAWLRALMEPLLGALDCLHREQVFHRDVAPDNILMVNDPDAPCGIRPVLLDFGAARHVISQNTQSLTAILKPSFAPIEQYAETTQLRQGPWTDLYGLAAVLHYCITGRTPVPATARAVYDDLPSLQQMASGLAQDFGRQYSPALLSTIDRALSVKPAERPSSAAAWRELLQQKPLGPSAESLPDDASPGTDPETEPALGRDVWKERTIMVAPAADQDRAAQDRFVTTQSLSTGHRIFHAAPPGVAGTASGISRSWVWAVGLMVLTAIVALSSWTVSRQPIVPVGAPAATVARADESGPAAATPSLPRTPPVVPPPADRQPREEVLTDSAAVKESLRSVSEARVRQETVGEVETARSAGPQKPAASEPQRQRPGHPTDSAPTVRRASTSAGPLNPRLACGDRVFIALAICMKRYCSRSPYAKHSECTRMRQQEEAQRRNFP